MTPQELKNSILQLAIQGKLVEQRPEEGTGDELYQQIKAEKQKLIKDGKLKKEKPLPEITEDELPFEIPVCWKWSRLNDIVIKTIKRGKSPTYIAQSNTLVFAQKCNTKAGRIDLSLAQFLDESKLEKYPAEEFMQDGDIVINSTGNGTLGRVGIYTSNDNPDRRPVVPDSHVTVIRVSRDIDDLFVFYGLKYYQPFMEKLGSGSTNQTELPASTVQKILFPIPPLAEQKRIVAKIEELLPLVERYGEAWTKLEEFNKKFPDDMKKSILQQAIQGKLVEQSPEEGTGEELYKQIQAEKQKLIKDGKLKKEKPLPGITEDEMPFEIPESWKWVHLNSIANTSLGKTINKTKDTGDKVSYLCSINIYWTGIDLTTIKQTAFSEEEKKKYSLRKGDLLICEGGDIGRAAVWSGNEEMYYQNALHRVRFYCDIDPQFYRYLFECYKYSGRLDQAGKGVTIQHLVQKELYALWIPLPPLAEQKRIVAKIEELLPLCEKLKK